MKKENRIGRWGFLLVLFLVLGLASGVKTYASDFTRKIDTGEWVTLKKGKGSTEGVLKFTLEKPSDVTIRFRNGISTTTTYSFGERQDSGTIKAYLDKDDYGKRLVYTYKQGEILEKESIIIKKLSAGTHKILLELDNVASLDVRVSVDRQYAAKGVSAISYDKSVEPGKWLSFSGKEGKISSRLKFRLNSAAKVKVEVRKASSVMMWESSRGNFRADGNFSVNLDTAAGYTGKLLDLDVEGTDVSESGESDRLARGNHYITLSLENIDAFEIRISVTKKYANPDFALSSNKKVSMKKWYVVSPGSSGKGKIRFDLAKPADIRISLKNVVPEDEESSVDGEIEAFFDTTSFFDDEQQIMDNNNAAGITSRSWSVKELSAGSHYLYFELDDIYTLDFKVEITKTYATGPATAVRLASGESMVLGTTLKLEPELVYPFQTLTGLKWSSSKKAVASVNKNGVVTAKKTGRTVITCQLKNGKKYNCTVGVKKNTVGHDATFSYTKFGDVDIDWTRMTYDGQKLVMNTLCYNYWGFKTERYDWIEINIFTDDGDLIAKKTFKNVSLNLDRYDRKKLQFVFPRKTIRIKNLDLVKADPYIQFSYHYTYTY